MPAWTSKNRSASGVVTQAQVDATVATAVNQLAKTDLAGVQKGTILFFDGAVWQKVPPAPGVLTQDAQGNVSWVVA